VGGKNHVHAGGEADVARLGDHDFIPLSFVPPPLDGLARRGLCGGQGRISLFFMCSLSPFSAGTWDPVRGLQRVPVALSGRGYLVTDGLTGPPLPSPSY